MQITSLSDIRKEARRRDKATGCGYLSALDKISRELGFNNFAAVRKHFTMELCK